MGAPFLDETAVSIHRLMVLLTLLNPVSDSESNLAMFL